MVRRRFRRRERRGVSHVQIQPTVLPAPDPGTIAVSSIAVLSIAALVCGAAMAAPRYTSFSVPDGSDTRAFGINSVGPLLGREAGSETADEREQQVLFLGVERLEALDRPRRL
jgi:hypothetical protein